MTMPAFNLEQAEGFGHVTVMPGEVVRALAPKPGGVYVDATAGGGGHSLAILEACPEARIVAFDRDSDAVQAASERLAAFGPRAAVMHAEFRDIPQMLADMNLAAVDGLVADLGISSHQLAQAERGMSFRIEGPLDMRMDLTRGETARELVQRLSQDALADVIFQLGEERRSRRVARCIKQALEQGEMETTLDLRRAVVRAVGPRRIGGIDPATRTFQALRIAVNGELEQLEALLGIAKDCLKPGGVAALISFHSLEDRLVKRALLDRNAWRRLWTKPLVASDAEQTQNPRSRSAKLRAAERIDEQNAGSEPPDSGDDFAMPDWYGTGQSRPPERDAGATFDGGEGSHE